MTTTPPAEGLVEQTICECLSCCDGEHAGDCKECAGWGNVGGDPCEHCNGDGKCPKCSGGVIEGENILRLTRAHNALILQLRAATSRLAEAERATQEQAALAEKALNQTQQAVDALKQVAVERNNLRADLFAARASLAASTAAIRAFRDAPRSEHLVTRLNDAEMEAVNAMFTLLAASAPRPAASGKPEVQPDNGPAGGVA